MVKKGGDEGKKQFTVMLKPEIIREIDRLAKEVELSRSQLTANLIEIGLDDARIFEKTGVLWLVRAGKKAKEYLEKMNERKDRQPMKG
jgi:hypothetical protein